MPKVLASQFLCSILVWNRFVLLFRNIKLFLFLNRNNRGGVLLWRQATGTDLMKTITRESVAIGHTAANSHSSTLLKSLGRITAISSISWDCQKPGCSSFNPALNTTIQSFPYRKALYHGTCFSHPYEYRFL